MMKINNNLINLINENNENIINEDNENIINEDKKSKYYLNNYRKEWTQKNKDKLNLYAHNYYIKKISNDEEYILKLRKASLISYHKNKELKKIEGQPTLKRGRPKKIIEVNETIKIKPKLGRPKKYII